jgi:hypothetical protein
MMGSTDWTIRTPPFVAGAVSVPQLRAGGIWPVNGRGPHNLLRSTPR